MIHLYSIKSTFPLKKVSLLKRLLLIFIIGLLSLEAISQCSGTYYDSGGAGSNYSDYETITNTYTTTSGGIMKIDFSYFDVENGYDFLRIYDGPNTSSPLIANLTGTGLPSAVISTGNSITVQFVSDYIVTRGGYAFDLSCVILIDCSTIPTLTLDNPTHISGTFGEVNSVYRYSNIITGYDANLRIVSMSHPDIEMVSIDEPEASWGGYDEAFQPIIDYNWVNSDGTLDTAGDKSVTFELDFFESGTNIPIVFPELSATAIDVDGSDEIGEVSEFIESSDYKSFSLQSTTLLSTSGALRTDGPITTFGGIDETATDVMVSYNNVNTSSFTFTFGATYGGASTLGDYAVGNSDEKRHHSLYMKCFALDNTSCQTVNPPLGEGNSRCASGSVELTASGCNGTVYWFDTPANGTSVHSGNVFNTPSLSSSATYYVECREVGCVSDTRTAVQAIIGDCIEETFFEAECSQVSSSFDQVVDPLASRGSFIVYNGSDNFSTPGSNSDRWIRHYVILDNDNDYNIFARTKETNSTGDSFWVRVNEGTWVRFNSIPHSSSWDWYPVWDSDNGNNTVDFSLDKGLNTIDFAYREGGTALDKIYITGVGGAAPNGEGAPAFYDCSNCEEPLGESYDACDDAQLTGSVAFNDTEPENSFDLHYNLVTNGTMGTASLDSNGYFTYTADNEANGIDSFIYERCYSFVSDYGANNSLYNACGEAKIIDTYVEGIEGSSSPTMTIPNPTDFTDLYIEVWVESICGDIEIEGVPVSASSVFRSNGSEDTEKIYRINLNSISSDGIINVTSTSNCSFSSMVAYVERNSPNGSGSSAMVTTNTDLYRGYVGGDDCQDIVIPVGYSDVARDLTVTVPLHEKDNTRIATVTATAGSITQSASVSSANAGPGAAVITITLSNVPASEQFVKVEVCSPNNNGDSFGVGAVSTYSTTCNASSLVESCCVEASAVINISNTNGTIAASSPAICNPDDVTITSQGSDGSGNYNYIWANGLGNYQDINVTVNATSDYTVTIVDVDNGCEETLTQTVTLVDNTALTIIGDTESCAGEDVLLTASGSSKFMWNTGDTSAMITVNPLVNTTYSVTGYYESSSKNNIIIEDGLYNLASFEYINATNNGYGQPPSLFNGVDETGNATFHAFRDVAGQDWGIGYDLGTDYQFDNIGFDRRNDCCTNRAEGGYFQIWNNGIMEYESNIYSGTGNDVLFASPAPDVVGDSITFIFKNGANTSYNDGTLNISEWVISGYSICESVQTHTVNVNTALNPSINSNDPLCLGSNLTLSVSGVASATWDGPASFSENGLAVGITNVNASHNGVYTVTVTDNNGCTATDSKNVVIGNNPTVELGNPILLCDGDSTYVVANGLGTGTLTYSWSTGETGDSIKINPSSNTSYSVTVQDGNGCQGTDAVNVNVSNGISLTCKYQIGTESEVSNQCDIEFCAGPRLALDVSPTTLSNYKWYDVNGNLIADGSESSIEISLSAQVSHSGVYTVVGTNNQGCRTTNTFNVTIHPNPTAGITAQDSVCSGTNLSLLATGATNVVWSGPNSYSSTNLNPTISGIGTIATGTYTAILTDGEGCADTTSHDLYVGTLPTVDLGSNVANCSGETITLTANGAGYGTLSYNWNESLGTGTTKSINLAAPLTGNVVTNYVVTITDVLGCQASDDINVTAYSLPSVSVSQTDETCGGDNGTITFNFSNHPNRTNIEFSINGGTTYTDVTDNSSSYTVSNLGGGTYDLWVRWGNGQCPIDLADVTIVAQEKPNAIFQGPTNICDSGTTTILPNSGGTWVSSDPLVATINNAGFIQSIGPGTVKFVFTDTLTNCISDSSAVLTVSPSLSLATNFLGGICLEDDSRMTMDIAGGTAPFTYSWTGPYGFTSSADTIDVDTSGNYYVTVTDGAGCTDNTVAYIYERYDPFNFSLNTTVCEGDDVNLSVSTGSAVAYQWGPNAANSTSSSITVTPSPPSATYNVTVTNNVGCQTSASAVVNVDALPTTSITGPTNICEGDTSALTSSVSGIWTSSNAGVATVSNLGHVIGISPGTAYFTFRDTSTGCYALPTSNITVLSKTTVGITGDTDLCVGQFSLLNPNVGGTWSSSDTSIAKVTNTGLVTAIGEGKASFIFTNSTSGCPSDPTDSITVNVIPTVSNAGPDTICVAESVQLNASGAGNWSSVIGSIAQVTSGGLVTGLSEGRASFIFVQEGSNCASDSIHIFVKEKPIVSLAGTSLLCEGGNIAVTSTMGSGTWSSSNATVATITQGGFISGLSEGSAKVLFLADNGCSSDSFDIVVNDTPIVSLGSVDSICVGASITLSPTSGGAWVSSNTLVATIDDSGVVNGVGAGKAVFTFTTDEGCPTLPTDSLEVRTNKTITITGASELCTGLTTTLQSSLAGGTWSSNDNSIATIDASTGLVTALSTGNVVFTYNRNSVSCFVDPTYAMDIYDTPLLTRVGDTTICEGENLYFTSNIVGGVWSSLYDTVATINSSGVVTVVSPGTVRFTVSHPTTGCASGESKDIVINPDVNAMIDFVGSVCLEDDTQLTASSLTGTSDFNYSWTGPNGFSSSDQTIDIDTNGNYYVTITDANGCLDNTSAFVYSRYLPLILGLNTELCEGEDITLGLTNTSGTTYQWSSNAGSSTNHEVTVTPSVPSTTYSVTVTNNDGCSAPLSAEIGVLPKPVVAIAGDTTICVAGSSQLSPSTGGFWSSNAPSIANVNNSGGVVGLIPGTATFTFQDTSTLCFSDPTKPLIVEPTVLPIITGSNEYCEEVTDTLKVDMPGGKWLSTNEAIVTIDSITGEFTTISIGAATIVYTISDGCFDPAIYTLEVINKPTVSFTGPSSVCAGLGTTLSPISNGSWVSSDTAVAKVTDQGVVTTTSAGTVLFTFTSIAGCTSTLLTPLQVLAEPIVSVSGSDTICIGSSTTLASNSNGIWVSNTPSIASVSFNGTVTGIAEGRASFTFYESSNGCPSNSPIEVEVVSQATPIFTTPTSICIGDTARITPNTGGSWVSSSPSIASITNDGEILGLTEGSANFTYTDTVSGCITAPSPNLTVKPLPIINLGGYDTICVGSEILVSPSSGGTWTSSIPIVADINASTLTGYNVGTTMISFHNTTTGCSIPNSIPVTVKDRPYVNFVGPSTACSGDTSQLSPSTGGVWSSSNGSVAYVSNNGKVTAGLPGVAKFLFAANDGICTSDSSSAFTVVETPNITLTGDNAICIGENSSFSPSSGGTWSSSDTLIAEITNSGVVTALSGGQVTFTFSDNSSTCNATESLPLTVFPPPPISLVGNDSICIGGTTTLIPNSGGVWTSSDFSIANITSTGQVIGLSAGTVTFTYVDNANSCVSNPSQAVNIMARPEPMISGPSLICEATTTNMTPSSGGIWSSSNDDIATITKDGTVTGEGQGIVKFTFVSDLGCASIESSPLIVIGQAEPQFLGNPSICINEIIFITPSTGGTWESSDTTIATITDGGLITGIDEGNVTFTFTDTINGCISDPSEILEVKGKPAITVPVGLEICETETFNVAPVGGGTWTSTDPTIAQINNNGLVTGIKEGVIQLYYQSLNTGCVSDISQDVTINGKTDPIITGSRSICIGDSSFLTPSTMGSWTSSDVNVATITNDGKVIGIKGGVAKFKYTNQHNCESDYSSGITVIDDPLVGRLGPEAICKDDMTEVFPQSGGLWSSADPSIATITNAGIVTGLSVGSTNLTFLDTVTGCSSSTNLGVTVLDPPVITADGPTDICMGYTTKLSSTEAGAWVTKDARIATVNTDGTVTGVTPGKVEIFLIKNASGCPSDPILINVGKCTNHDFDVTLVNKTVLGDLSTNDNLASGAIYGTSTNLVSKPSSSIANLNINTDGTYDFNADTEGKYIYSIQICTDLAVKDCSFSYFEVTVVDNQYTQSTPVVNIDYTTTFAGVDDFTEGDDVDMINWSNDHCVRASGCSIDRGLISLVRNGKNGSDIFDINDGINYTPNAGHLGVDTIKYKVCVDAGLTNCSETYLFLTIASVTADNMVVAPDDFKSTLSTTAVSGNVLENDYDPEGNTLTVTPQGTVASPITVTGGSYFIDALGDYTFSPDSDFSGPTSFVYTVCDDNGTSVCSDATVHLLVLGGSTFVTSKIYLEGALRNNGGEISSEGKPLMRDDLRSSPYEGGITLIPTTDPHTSGVGLLEYAKVQHKGPGLMTEHMTITNPTTVFAVEGDDAIVDWVYVEIRAKSDSTMVLGSRSGLVQRDGDIVDLDGISPVSFDGIGVDSFYLMVKHRNHLGVMSMLVPSSDIVDFTDPNTPTFNFGLKEGSGGIDYTGYTFNTELMPGYNVCWAGDANSDGRIIFSGGVAIDANAIQGDVLFHPNNIELQTNFDFAYGYLNGDYNLDGKVKFTNPNDDTNMLFSQLLLYDLNTTFSSIYSEFIQQVPE